MNAITDFPPLDAADNTIDFAALAKQPPMLAVLQDVADISNGKAVVKLNATEAGLAALRADLSGKRYDLKTVKGNDEARADRQRCVKLRTALEAKRKAMKAPALEFGKLIDGEAKRITEAIIALEAPIDSLIQADEKRRADEKAERERIEAERIAGLKGQADTLMRVWLERCAEPDMTAERIGKGIEQFNALSVPADLADVADYWSAQQSITLGRMQTMQADMARREDADRLAVQRAELERQQAVIRAEQDRIAGINRRINEIKAAATGHERASSATLGEAITAVQALRIDADAYAELLPLAMAARVETLATLNALKAAAELREATAAIAAREEARKAEQDTQEQEPQQVLKAEPATADATDRGNPANASPDGGPMGAEQPAAAGLAGEEQAQAGVAENPHQQQAGLSVLSPADAAADGGAGAEVVAAADDAPAAPAFALTPEPTDLLGDTATIPEQTTEQAARALLDHIAEAFPGRFPSDPKPGRAWFSTLNTLACNLNDTI